MAREAGKQIIGPENKNIFILQDPGTPIFTWWSWKNMGFGITQP